METPEQSNPERPVRKQLDHRGPLSIDVSSAWYFITLCADGHQPWTLVGGDHRAARVIGNGVPGGHALPRVASTVGGDHRAPRSFDEIATLILDEARFFHTTGKWFLAIMLIMPDHLHFIVHGPPGGRPLPAIIGDFKRYLTTHFGIAFQADFFDTRLRDAEHFAEKWNYICRNPVARGLVATPRDWPHVIAFDRNTGEECPHR